MQNIFELFKESLKNKNTWVPNLLTASRLLGTIVIPPLFFSGNYIGALLATAGFSITDFFDGRIARKTGGYSEFGKILDPIVDKIFAVGLTLAILPLSPILVINLIPEVAIALINSKSYKNQGKPKSSYLGKLKTFALFPTIGLCYINAACNLDFLNIITTIASISTLGLQSVATFDYYQKAKQEENKSTVSEVKEENTDIFEETKEKENTKTLEETKEKENTKTLEETNEIKPVKELTRKELIQKLKEEKENLIGQCHEQAKIKKLKNQEHKID